MESNRDEALRCLRLAEKFLQQGEKEKAAKFGLKAKKLFPSGEAEGMKNVIRWIKIITKHSLRNVLISGSNFISAIWMI